MKKIIGILIWIACSITQGFAQEARKENARPELRRGNALYEEQKYDEAQNVYREALKKDPTSYTGMFNMGDALYKGKQFAPAREAMDASAKATTNKLEQARAYHNIGNTWLEEKKWEEAIAAYKQALRLNPTDADTKYNLAYAQAMLKKNGPDKNNKDKKDKKDKDKKDQDKKDQDKKEQDKKDQDKKDQDKKDQDKKDQDKKKGDDKDGDDPKDQQGEKDKPEQRPQGQPSKLTRQQAEQMLNALRQDEKKIQDRKASGRAIPVKLDKDW